MKKRVKLIVSECGSYIDELDVTTSVKPDVDRDS